MSQTTVTPPWHFWVIAILALLWNAMGSLDYVMTQTQNAEYLAQFSEQQLQFFFGFPTWVVACWAVAVWGGVLGSLLLLMRRKVAASVFLISWLAMIVTTFHNFVLDNGLEVVGDSASLIFTAVIFVVAGLLYGYARKLTAQQILH
ncbi:hypothetical protein [Ferrimonas aestuarii]|uniref:Uncharacterized protein n=1 Tax=Ferrimonas aestuarii TaxID=2569539 RepID=A0A4U1BJT2_9GAMM|nr:hypothetical protein [Ferrimonas aestuarii]TKB51664.1 hypothetical protein FCL42_17635 [Ferrimonas aestuarii]